MVLSNTWVNIDLDAILHNFNAVQEKAGVPVCAVVKADAYGHGAVPVAKHLEAHAAMFAVSSVAEALELRQAGIQKPILLLGHTPAQLMEPAVEHALRVAISTREDGVALAQAAQKLQKTGYAHLAVDTGMSRLGFQVTEESAAICTQLAKLPGLEIEGVFSHYATADETDLSKARAQTRQFDHFLELLRENGVEPKLRHLDNSAGTVNFEGHYDMVRAGIVLYGVYPSDEVDPALLPLQPAMTWETAVSHVKKLEPGRAIGYGGTFVTQRQMVVATIPVGYADGYRRSLSGRYYVLIRGQRAPILGRVCMDQMMVDVTDIPGVTMGDRVVLLGRDGQETITAQELGAAAGSFSYEQLCAVGHRVERVYF